MITDREYRINIHSVEQAASLIERKLANMGIDTHKHPTARHENGKHVYLKNRKDFVTYYIKFATAPFLKFGDYFRQYKGQVGDSMNQDRINELQDNDVLFFAQPHYIYYCSVAHFKEFALVRPNDKSQGKLVMSIAISKLERFI